MSNLNHVIQDVLTFVNACSSAIRITLLVIVFSSIGAIGQNASHPNDEHVLRGRVVRPVMHTYFERIPIEHRFTDMSDEDDNELLDFWKKSWQEAGWEPVVLGLEDAQRHPRFNQYEQDLNNLRLDEFSRISFRRYLAMATTGGWMCDYDVFPLRDFRSQGLGILPYNGQFALYGIVSPALAVADAANWETILQTLLKEAKQHVNSNSSQWNHWNDSMGILELFQNSTINYKTHRLVMPANLIMVPEPWPNDFCHRRQFRKEYLVVHFDPRSMLLGAGGFNQALPRFRSAAAREYVPLFSRTCGINMAAHQ